MKGKCLLRFALTLFFAVNFSGIAAQIATGETLVAQLKTREYKAARKAIINTINRNPDQQEFFYNKALEVYDSSIVSEPASKRVLIDSIFKIIEVWHSVNSTCEVLNEEAKRYFIYCKPDKSYKENICPYLRSSFGQCQNFQFYPESVLAFSECVKTYSFTIQKQESDCDLENLIWKYLIDHPELLQNQKLNSIKYKVKYALLTCPGLSCGDLDSLLLKESANENLDETKKVNSLLSQKNCTKSKLYQVTAKAILDHEPTFNGLYQFANLNKKEGKVSEAYSYLVKAEKLSVTQQEKSMVLLSLAELLELQNNFEKAKEFAQIASVTDPENKDCFVFLANLYKKAESICKPGRNEELAALYQSISQYYKKAGLETESLNYKKLSANLSSSVKTKKVKLECFINEEVELIRK